jgi:hypothetical protein
MDQTMTTPMPHPIELRPVTETDRDAWLSLWRDYQTFYKVEIPAEVTAVTWSRLLGSAEAISPDLHVNGPSGGESVASGALLHHGGGARSVKPAFSPEHP